MISELVQFLRKGKAGALCGSRVHPIGLPQESTLPAMTYLVVDWPNGYSQDGRSHGEPRLQFDGYATTYEGARELGKAIRNDLEDFTVGMGYGGWVDGPRDMGEPPELGRWRVMVEWVAMGVRE